MAKLLLKCSSCGYYTFKYPGEENTPVLEKKICPKCSSDLKTPHPPKFSMENKYIKYLRELKRDQTKV